MKKEREVHQKLLADSHGLVMDLRWQIHHREKNWNREKVELLERLDSERQEWGRQREELLWRVEQVGVRSPRVGGGGGCTRAAGVGAAERGAPMAGGADRRAQPQSGQHADSSWPREPGAPRERSLLLSPAFC